MPRKQLSKEAAFLYIEKLSPQLPFPAYWLDLEGEILGGNQAALDYFEFDQPHFLFGQTLHELYPQTLADQIDDHNQLVLESGEIISQAVSMVDLEGRSWEFKAMKIPIKNELGLAIGLILLPDTDTSLRRPNTC